MTGLGIFRRSQDERAEMSARRSAAAAKRHARARAKALLELARWSKGATPMPGLTEATLNGLAARGLAERRWVITRDGERALAQLLQAQEGQP